MVMFFLENKQWTKAYLFWSWINFLFKIFKLIYLWKRFLHQNKYILSFLLKILVSDFFKSWKQALKNQGRDIEETKSYLDSINPFFIPRNHVIEQIIEETQAESRKLLDDFLHRMENPFSPAAQFTDPPKQGEAVQQTFCGT